jgi:hypothetical protein
MGRLLRGRPRPCEGIGLDSLGSSFHDQPDGRSFGQPSSASLLGGAVLKFEFELVELAHLTDEPQTCGAGFQERFIKAATAMGDAADTAQLAGLLPSKCVIGG